MCLYAAWGDPLAVAKFLGCAIQESMKAVNGRNFVWEKTHETFESGWSNGAMSKRNLRHKTHKTCFFVFIFD